MGIEFEVEFRGDHVHVQLTPEYRIDPERRDEFWQMIRDVCEGHDCRSVLVEGYVPPGEHAPAEVVAAGEYTATVPNLWLAFHLQDFVPSESSELFEAVAASKGVRVKFFDSTEAALNWLRANAPR